MKLYPILFLFFSILFLWNCKKSKFDVPMEEYQVYNAYFSDFTDNEEFEIDSVRIAILDSTSIRYSFLLKKERIANLEKEWGVLLSEDLISDFNIKNSSKHHIQDHFQTELKYQIIKTSNYTEIFENSFSLLIFEEKYPDVTAILKLSRIGFNSRKDKALLFTSINCGSLCGSTWFLYLEKVEDDWKLINEQMLTIR